LNYTRNCSFFAAICIITHLKTKVQYVNNRNSELYFAFFEILLQLPLYPLQRIVDGLDVSVQLLGDFLVRFALEVQ